MRDLTVTMDPALYNIGSRVQYRYSNYVLWLLPLLTGLQSFRYVPLSDTELRLIFDSWNSFEPLHNPFMDAVRSIQSLKRFHVKLVHGKSRDLPIFPDLQHRSGAVEQTVALCHIDSFLLARINYPNYVVRNMKGLHGLNEVSIPGAPSDALAGTSRQPPPYRKIWLEGYDWSSGKHSLGLFRNMFATLGFLEFNGCKGTDSMMDATTGGYTPNQLKSFKVVNSFDSDRYYTDRFGNLLQSFAGLEEFRLDDRGIGLLMLSALGIHSSTLQTLELHDRVYEDDPIPYPAGFNRNLRWHTYITDHSLSSLRHDFPQLRSLHIDMLAKEIQHEVSFYTSKSLKYTDFSRSPLQ